MFFILAMINFIMAIKHSNNEYYTNGLLQLILAILFLKQDSLKNR